MSKIVIGKKIFYIIEKPSPHILVPTKKELHGWWPGKRECTAERMLINPYNGCSIGCFFCYSSSYPGYFQIAKNNNIIIVARDFDKVIKVQLDSIRVACCGYLSPVADPFQHVNNKYHLSEKIIEVFVEKNIPIEFITKARIPERAIELIKRQFHSFAQVSILTVNENLRKILVPGGAEVKILFDNLVRLKDNNVFSVCRIDPIFPFISDDLKSLKELIDRAIDCGCNHIIASILDIPLKIKGDIFKNLAKFFGQAIVWDYRHTFIENIDGWLNAKIDYRKKIFDRIREYCDKKSVTFSLCMEYELGKNGIKGLNKEFSSSLNCEGINIPVYIKRDDRFSPALECNGACLYCTDAKCGISDLAMGKGGSKKDWKLKDYRKWSNEVRISTNKRDFTLINTNLSG